MKALLLAVHAGTIVVSILLPCVAPTHQSASFVFTDFQGVGITTSEVSGKPCESKTCCFLVLVSKNYNI